MKKRYLIAIFAILMLNACTKGTTDPRQGGLFSYNPDAYEQRLYDRESHLTDIENDTQAQTDKSTQLKKNLSSEKNKMR